MNIGYVSQLFFAVCLLPQIVALFVRKTTKGISLGMWVFQFMGYTTGLLYGLSIHQFPLISGNLWGILCSLVFALGFYLYRNE